MIERLILVRHGQTEHNLTGIAQGWNDSPLSAAGREQVLRLAERMPGENPTALYSSTLGRALSTAEAIAAATGLPIIALDDLREMSYGGWEGRSFLDIRREDEALYRRWISEPDAVSPDGESHSGVRERMARAIASIDSPRPIVVSHGTAIRIVATALLDLPVMSAKSFAQDNASFNLFIHRGTHWVLKVWNDTTHVINDER